MGLLDRLLNKVVQEKVSEAVRSALSGNQTPSTSQTAATLVSAAQTPSPAQTPVERPIVHGTGNVISYNTLSLPEHQQFDALFHQLFPNETIRSGVSMSALISDAPAYAMPVNFMFYRNQAPSLAILVVEKDRYKLSSVLATMDACSRKGLRVLRFISDFENEPSYVQKRILDNL